MSGRLVFMPTEKVEAVDALHEHWQGHRRNPRGQSLKTATGTRSLVTRTPSQKLPKYPCEWLTRNGAVIVLARQITPDNLWTLIELICKDLGLDPAETMAKPSRGRQTVTETVRRQARANIVHAIAAAGVRQRRIADTLGVTAAEVSRLVKQGAEGVGIDLPEALGNFVFRRQRLNRNTRERLEIPGCVITPRRLSQQGPTSVGPC